MASFPQLFSGSAALYPIEETVLAPTGRLQFTNYTEQRWRSGRVLRRFSLIFEGVNKSDRNTIQTFFDDRKGGFDATWDITLAGVNYQNMVFESDTFNPRELHPHAEHWTFTLACRQIKPN